MTFNTGDIVKLKPSPWWGGGRTNTAAEQEFSRKWTGLICEVLHDYANGEKLMLLPLKDRPDGYGRRTFAWSTNGCELLIPPTIDTYEID